MIARPPVRALLRELAGRGHHDPHDETVRLAVRLRARDCCEYCLLTTIGQFHVDHIVPSSLWRAYAVGNLSPLRPHAGRRGPDHLDNYAWSCPFCNAALGPRAPGSRFCDGAVATGAEHAEILRD